MELEPFSSGVDAFSITFESQVWIGPRRFYNYFLPGESSRFSSGDFLLSKYMPFIDQAVSLAADFPPCSANLVIGSGPPWLLWCSVEFLGD